MIQWKYPHSQLAISNKLSRLWLAMLGRHVDYMISESERFFLDQSGDMKRSPNTLALVISLIAQTRYAEARDGSEMMTHGRPQAPVNAVPSLQGVSA